MRPYSGPADPLAQSNYALWADLRASVPRVSRSPSGHWEVITPSDDGGCVIRCADQWSARRARLRAIADAYCRASGGAAGASLHGLPKTAVEQIRARLRELGAIPPREPRKRSPWSPEARDRNARRRQAAADASAKTMEVAARRGDALAPAHALNPSALLLPEPPAI